MCESPKVSETCFVHLCIASAGNQVKRPLPEARTKEDGTVTAVRAPFEPGKSWKVSAGLDCAVLHLTMKTCWSDHLGFQWSMLAKYL